MRRMPSKAGLLAFLVATASAAGRADVWDPGDDDNTTSNELLPGGQQTHNLIAPNASTTDEDWFFVHFPPRTSWEFVMDAMGPGIVGASDPFTLVDAGGALIASSSSILGRSRSLRFENGSPGDLNYFVRATSTGCTTTCGNETVYILRTHETTLAVPRFNNSATQTTFLILENRSPNFPVSGHVWFLSTAGLPLANYAFTLSFGSSMVLNTATVAGAGGQGGTIQISHTAKYGQLDGKAVALEPGTGFTFDTPVLPRVQ